MQALVDEGSLQGRWARTFLRRPRGGRSKDFFQLWVAFSPEVDQDFVRQFRRHATPETRLLVVNERQSADTILTRLLGLQIRSPQRLYVADCLGSGKSHCLAVLLQRLTCALGSKDNSGRILDAKIEAGVLRVISPEFERLDVPLAQISALADKEPAILADFAIDEDGSFIHWPNLDVHLGWEQLAQIVNPEAARKAWQKHRQFNIRYGRAVHKVREQAGLKPSDITGISEKQLRRIESGSCRLTCNAVKVLSQAHGLKANGYLQKLAEALST